MSDDNNDNNDDYEVGYKKPPKNTQFGAPGGNPRRTGGRPKGSKNLKTDFQEEFQSMCEITEGSKKTQLTKQRAFVKRIINDALSGKEKAIKAVLDLDYRYNDDSASSYDDESLSEAEIAILQSFLDSVKEPS